MRERLLILLVLAPLLLCLAIVSNAHARGQGHSTRAMSSLRCLFEGLQSYHRDTGAFPANDHDSPWFFKLAVANYVPPDEWTEAWHDSAEMRVSGVDARKFVYEPPPPEQDKTIERAKLKLRWVGNNGLDDGGSGDDVDARRGANWGHYNKSGYPRAIAIGAAAVLLLPAWLVVIHHQIGRVWRLSLLLAYLGAGLCLVGGCAATNPFRHLAEVGAACVVASLVLGIGLCVCEWRSRCVIAAARARNRCVVCGYDLRGSSSGICSECGSMQSV